MIHAYKYHSYGNDFLVVPAEETAPEHYADLAGAICDRHFGVGSDGCMIVARPSGNRSMVRIFNRDGSEAGMSGNGTRCACTYLHHQGLIQEREVILETASGPKLYTLLEHRERRWRYKCRMGIPSFEPSAIPFQAPANVKEVIDYPLELDNETIHISALTVGNPQCVIFGDDLPEAESFRRLGPVLERHSRFPERTNVSFVRVEDPHRLRIKIWERGAGPTQSSGTGACGAAAAAVRAGKARSPVEVITETGQQLVEWNPPEEIILTGESEFVAEVKFLWGKRV